MQVAKQQGRKAGAQNFVSRDRIGQPRWLSSPIAVALATLPVSLVAALWLLHAAGLSLWWAVPLHGVIGAALTLAVLALAHRSRR
ncbi:hypothetical protein [Limimaricola pyoseonensis]|uniref:Uncharacterized protein n=1 Tax=Limimaricola pyoseonensis TaxID=521013 RepID=A0A1G7J191_9RHOB|nr:hypothetical protein [Limimaricola pyoseonensis]SDF18645.1 hypothetical protein SAMN04488567_3605 [Limimaricola pyoseonensis]